MSRSRPSTRTAGNLLYAGVDGNATHQGDPTSVKLGPRAGFAYSLNEETVLRGGYGLFWSPVQYGFPNERNMGTRGFTATNAYFSSADGGLTCYRRRAHRDAHAAGSAPIASHPAPEVAAKRPANGRLTNKERPKRLLMAGDIRYRSGTARS